MAFAFKRRGAWWIGYTDQTGRAVMQATSCTRLSHAAEVAERMEAMGKRLRLGLDLKKAELSPAARVAAAAGLRKDEVAALRWGDLSPKAEVEQ